MSSSAAAHCEQHTRKRAAEDEEVIAREWVTFVVLLAVRLTIAPLVVITITEEGVKLAMLLSFYEALSRVAIGYSHG